MGDTRWATAPVNTWSTNSHPDDTGGRGQGIPGAHHPQTNRLCRYPGRVARNRERAIRSPRLRRSIALISAAPKARLSGHDDLNPTHHRSNKDGDPVTTATDYRLPRPGRKYIDATERADQKARQAQLNRAKQHIDVIRAAETITCTTDPRFKHLLNNDLICARCNTPALTILETDNT